MYNTIPITRKQYLLVSLHIYKIIILFFLIIYTRYYIEINIFFSIEDFFAV